MAPGQVHESGKLWAAPVGKAFLSVRDADKQVLVPIARELIWQGYQLVATAGTAEFLQEHSVECESVNKVTGRAPAYRRPDQER